MAYREMEWQGSDNTPLLARLWQPAGAAKAVVCLVHGLGEHSGRYQHVAEALNEDWYALLASDLRGHGRSGGQRGHAPSYDTLLEEIDLLLAQATEHFPDRPRFLYGHSMGGNLVLNYALRRRPSLAGVIATSPWLRLAFAPPPYEVMAGRLLNWVRPAAKFSTKLKPEELSHDLAVVQAYAEDPLVHGQISARLYTNLDQSGQWALAHAADFPLPLLLMHGAADPITSPEASAEFAAAAPDAVFRLWPDMRHETHNEIGKDRVLAALIQWLKSHTAVS